MNQVRVRHRWGAAAPRDSHHAKQQRHLGEEIYYRKHRVFNPIQERNGDGRGERHVTDSERDPDRDAVLLGEPEEPAERQGGQEHQPQEPRPTRTMRIMWVSLP